MKTALIVGDHPVTHIGCGQLLRDLGYDEVFEALTEREHQVLRLIGRGEDLQSIADALCISYKTAANTSSTLKRKLGARNTTELVRLAIETGLS
ncbi:response regulator transcription factor [Rhodovulum sp.]|uniref:response regulator transcription factor n=1 Tax=Rhodovulum sp. TaxID=34009 RepID=UPI0017ED8BF4|nr:helix-turn-helix transcriptional regulator [Rhodovulum sp.]HDR28042.1 LuxR family transcriptional regulator [Rhodovulum sp.]